jgi:REP element-mobilizing transposase RayT
MPRTNRHFRSSHVWHITHRCHRRESLRTKPPGPGSDQANRLKHMDN